MKSELEKKEKEIQSVTATSATLSRQLAEKNVMLQRAKARQLELSEEDAVPALPGIKDSPSFERKFSRLGSAEPSAEKSAGLRATMGFGARGTMAGGAGGKLGLFAIAAKQVVTDAREKKPKDNF